MMPGPCGFKGCQLRRFHLSDCEPTHAGKLAYWGERALDIRSSMERDGLSLDEVGRIFNGAAPTLRPPPMPPEPYIPCLKGVPLSLPELDELEQRSVTSDLKGRGGSL